MQSYRKPKAKNYYEFGLDITRAKSYPILDIAKSSLVLKKVGIRYSAKCPFHNENHASFFIFPETNTYHCFGCGEHGDVINFVMKIYNKSFKEAVLIIIKQ